MAASLSAQGQEEDLSGLVSEELSGARICGRAGGHYVVDEEDLARCRPTGADPTSQILSPGATVEGGLTWAPLCAQGVAHGEAGGSGQGDGEQRREAEASLTAPQPGGGCGHDGGEDPAAHSMRHLGAEVSGQGLGQPAVGSELSGS